MTGTRSELVKYFQPMMKPPKKGKSGGIVVDALYASQDEQIPPAPKAKDPAGNVEDNEINQLLIDHPEMNASTFWNTLKSKGMKIVKTTSEADSGSSNAAALRVQKERAVTISEKNGFKIMASLQAAKLVESAKDNGIGYTTFDVILIREGLGNLKDAYYYTKEALESAVPVFEGKKIYADHPSLDEEQVRPERSVRDILGHFENVRLEETDDGGSQLSATLRILPDKPYEWARGLMRHSVEFAKKYPDKEFVGLSINASGDAEEMDMEKFSGSYSIPDSAKVKLATAREQGVGNVKIVSKITDAVSCDLVTEAGAGGKIRSLMEQDKESPMSKKVKENEEKKHESEDQKDPSKLKPESEKKENEEKKEGEEDPSHDDAEQDKELIKSMIDKYMKDEQLDESESSHLKQCYEMCKEAGMEEEEAMKCAAYGMKMAKLVKQAEAKQAEGEEEPKPEDKKDEEAPKEEKKESDEKKEESHKESARLAGENAALKAKLEKIENEKYMDGKLRDLKESRSVTDQIRKLIGEPKSKKSIDEAIETFMEGVRAARGGESDDMYGDFLVGGEKLVQSSKKEMTFDDCVND